MSEIENNNWIWWKHGVIYHIYPRSFYDSNFDGIGDIKGIINKLDYLVLLGIDAIWLSPIYLSPKVDFGYDVNDYRKIDPEYGNLNDFKNLLSQAHNKNIRIIMDMIMNHTSDQHPWFIDSSKSTDNPKRDWYIWKADNNGKVPNNWKSSFGSSAWQFDTHTNEYYLHSFLKEQPDLNWRNKEMAKCFFEDIKFWLDLGVDGFRLDVINMIIKDKKYRNNPFKLSIPFLQEQKYSRNRSKSHNIVKKLRKLIDKYDDKVLVGEIYVLPPGDSELSASYLTDENKGIHLAFDFSLIFQKWNAKSYFNCIEKTLLSIPENAWPCNVLSNHDLKRNFNRNPFRFHRLKKAKIEAVLLLTLKGTPFVYYGEEIGMKNSLLKYRDIKDPLGKKYWPFYNGRDGARTPMQWNSDENAGFSKTITWLPVNKNYKRINVSEHGNDNNSLFNIYRTLINLRKNYPSLQKGDFIPLIKGRKGILAYTRKYENEELTIILNFSSTVREINIFKSKELEVVFSTHKNSIDIEIIDDLNVSPFEASIYKIKKI